MYAEVSAHCITQISHDHPRTPTHLRVYPYYPPKLVVAPLQLLVSRTVIWGEKETKGMPSLTDLDVSRNQWLTGIALR